MFELLQFGWILFIESLKYLWRNDYPYFVRTVCSRVVNVNVVFAKVFQALVIQYAPCAIGLAHDITPASCGVVPTIEGVLIDPKHIGSGLVSLVYAGTYNDQNVVIKVQRSGIKVQIEQGISSLRRTFTVLNYLPPLRRFDLLVMLAQIEHMLIDQLNLSNEVANQNKYRTMFEYHPRVVIPKVHLFCEQYIVMERLYPEFTECTPSMKLSYASLICEISLKSTVIDGFIHADMHAGNLLFLHDGKLGIIDFGLTLSLTVPQRNDYLTLSMAMQSSDYDKAAFISLDRYGYKRDPNDTDPTNERKAVESLRDVFRKSDQVTKYFGVCEVSEMVTSVYPYGYALTPYFYQVMMSMASSDTLLRTLFPNFQNIVKEEIKKLVDTLD